LQHFGKTIISQLPSFYQELYQNKMPFMWTKGWGGKHAGKLDFPSRNSPHKC
jgi:hypothetical protein